MPCLIRQLLAPVLAAALLLLTGCETKPGVIFPPLANAPQWPPPPDAPRITYVGKLESSRDLKPGVNGWDALGQALFGQNSAHSMLSPLAVCSDGTRVFVADSNAQCVHVFDLASRAYAAWKPAQGQVPFAQPVGIAWDASAQRLLVSDSIASAVFLFDTAGRCTGTLGKSDLQRPVGIAIDPTHDHRIFVADAKAHQILVFTADGALRQRLGSRGEALGQFNFPTNLAIDAAGQLYVSDSLNFRVQQFDADLKPLRQFGKKGDLPGYFAEPKGIATDSEGHVYVVDGQFENVQIFDPQGRVLMDFGEEGNGPGQFWLPTAICIDAHDRLWIADSYNRRLQVFDYKKSQEVNP
jgi:DNA-binding beta-propeller fold protein YncE